MFTVVILEQEYLDSIHEYHAFLKPFLDNSHIAFCRWRLDGQNIMEAVPGLYDKVSRHERWRAIVVCDEEGLQEKNPFDRVAHSDPPRPVEMEDAEYFQIRRQARIESYTKAAQKPLVRLMTWLCQAPLVTEGMNDAQDLDPEFGEFLAQARAKELLRGRILDGHIPQITLPAEVICIAKRCFDREEDDIQTSWDPREDIQYSRFYDWNLYFDKMRYLLFDILPKSHRNYTFDHIRFLYALMVLAENEIPMAVLSPNRVYSLYCQNDEDALKRFLGHYDSKLAATREKIAAQIVKLENAEKPRLTDKEAEAIFCSNVTVPVSTVTDFDQSALFIRPKGIGLSTDCPSSEEKKWLSGYQDSRKALGRYLKLPRRALKKTAADLHRLDSVDLDAADALNQFQLEDVADYVGEEELKMVQLRTCDLYDTERFVKDLEAQNERVQSVIERRMTRKWTIILGAVALGLYLAGFVPMFLSNLKAENGTLFSLLFLLVGGCAMAAIALVALVLMCLPLRKAYSDYNGIMDGIVDEVEGSLTEYSRYLSHACNIMRGNSVLNHRQDTQDPDSLKIRILRKHEMDVICVREELHEVFGTFIPKGKVEMDIEESYRYDFLRPIDMEYPMPYTDAQKTKIEFLQKGNLVEVPVDFIKSMRIRREELHD